MAVQWLVGLKGKTAAERAYVTAERGSENAGKTSEGTGELSG